MKAGAFVFVVCGAREHIDTLHFSLKHLKAFSSFEIIVLTDSSRNEIPVIHSNVVDVKTPENLDHHQASIFLKVGIHHHLPKGKLYCYLDTDVVAISEEVDEIFKEFVEPIRFAADHCKVSKFSPRAIHCGCLDRIYKERKKLQKAWDACSITDPSALKKKAELDVEFKKLDENKLLKKISDWKYKVVGRKFWLSKEFWFDKEDRVWYDKQNNPILFEDVYGRIERETGLRHDPEKDIWFDDTGINVWLDDCDHLVGEIDRKFNIKVADRDWQHWNGGVFLFNYQSHDFLESWFKKTMEIFEDLAWKTRDQGTLIATAWEFGLTNHSVLDKKWNFIADRTNLDMKVNESTGEVTDDDFATVCHPAFMHVYHDFGDTNWYLWNWIAEKGNSESSN